MPRTAIRRSHGKSLAVLLAAGAASIVGMPMVAQAYTVPTSAAVASQQAVQARSTAPVWLPTWVPSIVGKTADYVTPSITWALHQYRVEFVVTPKPETALVVPATDTLAIVHAAYDAHFGSNALSPIGYTVTKYASRSLATKALWKNKGLGIVRPSQFGPAQKVALSSTWTAYWHPKGDALTWREGDWTIEVSAWSSFPTALDGVTREARQIATTLEHYRLPPKLGIISIVGNASGGQFAVRWQEGRSVISTSGQNFYGISLAFPKQGVELVLPNPMDDFTPWAHFVASMVHP